MAIKARFENGATSTTANGLYQWDYGQELEIESADFGSEIVEVHFACNDMPEAIVRLCSFSGGIGTVTIPNDCLERSSPITAWIYEIGTEGTSGKTTKVINLPITSRKRPATSRDVPEDVSNTYTQLIGLVNDAVDALEAGDVAVGQAKNATHADNATGAVNAGTANHAVTAGKAENAENAVAVKLVDTLKAISFEMSAVDQEALKTTLQLPEGYFPLCITGCSINLSQGSGASYKLTDSGGCPQVEISAVGENTGTDFNGTHYSAEGTATLTGLFLRYSTSQ